MLDAIPVLPTTLIFVPPGTMVIFVKYDAHVPVAVVPVTLIALALSAPLAPFPIITALPEVAVAVKLIVPLFAVSAPLYQQQP